MTATRTPASAEHRTFRVRPAGPLDLARSVEFLRRNGDDLMDRWDGARLVRLLRVGGLPVPVVQRSTGDVSAPELTVTAPVVDGVDPAALSAAVAGQFAPVPAQWAGLLRRDRRLAALAAATPGVRVLGLTDPLYSLVRSITAQQVNLRFATRIRARLAEAYAPRHPVADTYVRGLDADALAGAAVADLRAMQLSERKASYLIGAAGASLAGLLDPAVLAPLPDEEFLARLTAVRGIGRWTAEWFGVRVLFRPFLVAGDVALRKAISRLYGLGRLTEADARELVAHWGAATHVAAQLVLETC